MSDFAVVINYKFTNEPSEAIILDTVSSVSVGSSATATNQPLVTGDQMIDHMFRQPRTMTIGGVCSLNGSKGIVVNGAGSKLANFERLFERIQKEAVQCDIYKISLQNDKDIRFEQRKNMILNSISWTEHINSLDFTLSFVEVIQVDVKAIDKDMSDEFLPEINEPQTLSFTNSLIDWSRIDAAICSILDEESLWTTQFKTFIKSANDAYISSIIIGGAAIAIGAVLTALNTTPVGWALTAVGLAVTAAVVFVRSIYKAFDKAHKRRKYAVKMFEYSKNEKKNAQEVERFADFIYGIHKQFEALNSDLRVYQISADKPQECLLFINDEFFDFVFGINNITHMYDLHVLDKDDNELKYMSNVTGAPMNFYDCTSNNYLIKTSSNERVYLLCPTEEKGILSNYFLLVLTKQPEDINNAITEIIRNAIFKKAEE